MLSKVLTAAVLGPAAGASAYYCYRKWDVLQAYKRDNILLSSQQLNQLLNPQNKVNAPTGAIQAHPIVSELQPGKRNIVVVGGGIIGAATCYILAKTAPANTQVILLEQHSDLAQETSHRNGCLFSLSLAYPWTNWGNFEKLLKSRNDPEPSYAFTTEALTEKNFFTWAFNFLLRCTGKDANYVNMKRMIQLAFLSREEFVKLDESDIKLETVGRFSKGTFRAIQTEEESKNYKAFLSKLVEYGGRYNEINGKEGVLKIEPGLRDTKMSHIAGVEFPLDFNVDTFKLSHELVRVAKEKYGAKVIYNADLKNFVFNSEKDNRECVGVITGNQTFIPANDVVVTAGNGTKEVLGKLGFNVPIMPAKGYTIKFNRPADRPPLLYNVFDDNLKIYVTTVNDTYRVSACAELCGKNTSIDMNRLKWIANNTQKLVGDLDLSTAEYWCGFRPLSPDSVPIIGQMPNFQNVWINSGHGAKGMVQALGSGRLITELLLGQKPSVPAEEYNINRFAFI